MEKIYNEILEGFKNLPHIGDVQSRILYNEGFRSIKEVAEIDPEELAKVLEIEKEIALKIVESAFQMVQKEGGTEIPQESGPSAGGPTFDPVGQIEGVGEKTATLLETNGFKTVQDVLKAEVERLSALPGIGIKRAEKLIQSAQRYVESIRNE
jgi:excinuclease UvrABC nuclease subunit